MRILDAIDRTDDAEVTVECNPDSVDAVKLAAYRAAGVNRLSFGVQSMSPHVLAALGRTHDPANVARSVALARAAGFERINLDLIYGTPGESLDDWRATLEGALALDVAHVSAYALDDRAGDAARPPRRRGRGRSRRRPAGRCVPPRRRAAHRGRVSSGTRCRTGRRPGEECRHNLLYWGEGEYLGIGCAAHGHTRGRRWWNVRTPERYIAAVHAGVSAEAGDERLEPVPRAEEACALALRTRAGSPVADAAAPVVDELAESGFVRRVGDRVVLTPRGRLLASDVTARLLVAGAVGTR